VEKLYQQLANILEDDEVSPDSKLKEYDTWDSLAALSLVAFVRTKFHVAITSEDLARVRTASELEAVVTSRQSEALSV